jgi:uncharacterized protein
VPLKESELKSLFSKCISPSKLDVITARTVYNFCISPFMVYCDKFAPKDKKDPQTEHQKYLMELGLKHEKNIISSSYPDAEKFTYTSAEEGFKQVISGMNSGVRAISGAPIIYLPEGLEGIADVIERRDSHPSIFGSYHYVVKEIKLAKNIQQHHILQTAFYNYIIGKIQKYTPPSFTIINRDSILEEHPFIEKMVLDVIEQIRLIFKGTEVNPTYGACAWPWETFNDTEAIKRNDISLVAGIGPSTKIKMIEKGIKTVSDLANCSSRKLTQIKGIGDKKARTFMLNAQALEQRFHIKIAPCSFPLKSTELFLDLEGTGESQSDEDFVPIDYLIGVIKRDRSGTNYVSFVAHGLDKEGEMFHNFLDWLKKQNDFIIYHWHHYEKTHVEKMIRRYIPTPEVTQLILGNMRDLYKDATASFAFPTYGNGLKQIAKYMGYQWKHADVDALETIAMYQQYIENPKENKENLQKIIDYNQDDCMATMTIKDWLVANLK